MVAHGRLLMCVSRLAFNPTTNGWDWVGNFVFLAGGPALSPWPRRGVGLKGLLHTAPL